jgi:hypothetical protein
MRSSVLPAIVAAALFAAPALAQTNSNPETGQKAQTETPSATSSSGAAKHHKHMAREELKQSLEQAGFKDIRITAESYVVHARDKDGSPVVMMISPDQVAGVVEEKESGSGSTTEPRSHGSEHNSTGTTGNSEKQ